MADRRTREYRAWILLLLPPILWMTLYTLAAAWFAAGGAGEGGPEVGEWFPYLLMANHALLFLLYWRFVRADGTTFASVGWRLPSGWESLWLEPFYGLVSGIALGFFNKLFLSPVLGRLEGAGANPASRFSLADLDEAALIPFLIAATLFAGIVEESIYRGYAITRLRPRMGTGWAVAVSTLLFGPLHFGLGLPGIAGAILLGLFLAIVFLWRGNLLAPVVAHAVVNAVAVLF